MFKFTNRAKFLTFVLLMVYWFGTAVAPNWYTSIFHPVDWISPVYAQSNIRQFPIAPTTTAGTLIANGSTTQDFYVMNYGLTVSTGATSGGAFSFVYGDDLGANNCASNQVAVTETFTVASGTTQFNKDATPQGNPIFKIPRNHDFCMVANAPLMNVDGFITGFYQTE